jgi:hypothetical protein
MHDTIQYILGTLVLLIMAFGWLARRHPEVSWLRTFDLRARLSPEQRRRLQRTVNVNAGAQLILLGLCLPIGYIVLKAVSLSDFAGRDIALVTAGSLICIVAGLVGVIRNVGR